MGNKNTSMNKYNGDLVRQTWKIGMQVNFRPKSWCGGNDLTGIITGHLYVNVLIVESQNTKYMVSVFRCSELKEKTICDHFYADAHGTEICIYCKEYRD